MKNLLNRLFKSEVMSFADRREVVKRTRARYGFDRRVQSSFDAMTLAEKINGLMAYNSLKQA